MKNYSTMALVSLLVLILAGSAGVMALTPEHCGMGTEGYVPGRMEGMAKQDCGLGLTEEQMEKLHALKLEHQKKMIDLKAEMKKLELGMQEEMMKAPDRESMMKHVDKMMELKVRMKKARIKMIFDAKKIMPEDKWKILLRHHMGRDRHEMGRSMGCGGMVKGRHKKYGGHHETKRDHCNMKMKERYGK